MKVKESQGQALVEWAIVIPLILIMTFGVCQWSLIQFQQNLVSLAAWRAARAQLVRESPYDAAAITLMPVAGWTNQLSASIENSDEIDSIVNVSTGENFQLPGWSEFPRSSLVADRLQVNILEEDWEKSTCEVIYRCELLFPFMEVFFAQARLDASVLGYGDTVSGDEVNVGFAGLSDEFGSLPLLKAGNFVELKAQATVPRIDRPQSDVDFGDWQGGPQYETSNLLFLNPNQGAQWETEQ